jgi:hypothetical protein
VIYVKCFFYLGGFSRPLWLVMAHPSRFHFKASPTLMAHSNHLIEIIYGQGGCVGGLGMGLLGHMT